MQETVKLNKFVTVTTNHKPDGVCERGTITQKNPDGTEFTVFITERSNFKELCDDLRDRGGIPEHVTIRTTGETHF